ncbi:hypothetical protein RVBP21_0700 [Pseudomonas phage BRkr]|nr:hypothetical protein RVBP21_0700 [Pseudomonas phage BRkr]
MFNKDLSRDVAIGVTYSIDFLCQVYGVKNSLDMISSEGSNQSLIDIAHVPMFHRRVPMNLVRSTSNSTGWKYHERDTNEETWKMMDLTDEKFREFVIPLDAYNKILKSTPPTGVWAAVSGLFNSMSASEACDILFGKSTYGEAFAVSEERRRKEAEEAAKKAVYRTIVKELHRQVSETQNVIDAMGSSSFIERLLRTGEYGDVYRIVFIDLYTQHFCTPPRDNEWKGTALF